MKNDFHQKTFLLPVTLNFTSNFLPQLLLSTIFQVSMSFQFRVNQRHSKMLHTLCWNADGRCRQCQLTGLLTAQVSWPIL